MIYWLSTQSIKSDLIVNSNYDEVVYVLSGCKSIGWDTETTGLTPFYDKPILDILGDEDNQVVIDLRTISREQVAAIHSSVQDKRWLAHNAKFDYKMFMHHLPEVFLGTCWDTMLAHQILYNGIDSVKHSLAFVCNTHLGVELEKEQRNTFIGKTDRNKFTVGEIIYAAKDVKNLERLREIFLSKNKENAFNYDALFDLEMATAKCLAKIELRGFDFDVDRWKRLAAKNEKLLFQLLIDLDTEVNRLSKQFPLLISSGLSKIRFDGPDYTPEEFNKYTSNETIIKIFSCVRELELLPIRDDIETVKEKAVAAKVKKVMKKRDSLNVTYLGKVVATQGSLFDIPDVKPTATLKLVSHYELGTPQLEDYLRKDIEAKSVLRQFIKLLISFRKKSKEVSTYGTKFLDGLINGRAYTQFTQLKVTGRLSSSSFKINGKSGTKGGRRGYNAQNIPGNLEMRHCFRADVGYRIATIDFSGQEISVAADQSKDPLLLSSLNDGLDLHSTLAQGTFRIVENDPELIVTASVNPKKRKQHKPILFGIFYGAGKGRIATLLDIAIGLAEKAYQSIRDLMPEFFKYQDGVQKFAVQNRYITDNSKFQRRRYFMKRAPDYRVTKQASNYPMQSTGASMVKEAIVEIERYFEQFRAEYPLIGIVGQVHDEIIFQIPERRRDIVLAVKRIMEKVGNSYLTDVKIQATVEWKPYWTK